MLKKKRKIPFIDYSGGSLIISSIMAVWLAGSLNTIAFAQQTDGSALFGGTLPSELTLRILNNYLVDTSKPANGGEPDEILIYGEENEIALVADTDGDFRNELIIRRGNRYFIDTNNDGGRAEDILSYGTADDTVFFMDFDGDDDEELVIRRDNLYLIDTNNDGGAAENILLYGNAEDTVMVADIDGDGREELVLRRSDPTGEYDWYLFDTGHNGGIAEKFFSFGKPSDFVFISRNKRSGAINRTDDLVIRRGNWILADTGNDGEIPEQTYTFGTPEDIMFVGDVEGNRESDLVIRRGNQFLIDTDDTGGVAEIVFRYGEPGDQVLVKKGSPDFDVYQSPASTPAFK